MFDSEFYPTPKDLIWRMLEPYLVEGRLPSWTILEPSAGKGDIADYVHGLRNSYCGYGRTDEKSGIHCIELNPDLQSVLRGKGYRLIGDDFLKFDGYGLLIDLIVMNPPFSHGAAHLLHAWEILKSGNIACILPRETLRNPCTRERQLLADVIRDSEGTVEDVGAAFSKAERRTGVEVCIVRLSKQDDSDIEGIFDSAHFSQAISGAGDEPIINEQQIACRNTIKRMADAYRATLASFAGAVKAMRELSYYGGEFSDSFSVLDKDGYRRTSAGVLEAFFDAIKGEALGISEKSQFRESYGRSYNSFAACVRSAAWQTVFEKTDMTRVMTQGVRDEFMKMQNRQQSIEFSEDNINKMLEMLFMSSGTIKESAIVEAFDLMTKYHKENRVHVEGWKSNDYWRVNRRVVLPYIVSPGFKTMQINYTHGKDIDDIDRGICLLEGLQFDQIKTIRKAIEESFGDEKMSVGDKVESHFFEIRYYRKGTAHFFFKDAGLWERFNVAACKGKKWLPSNAA